MKLHLSVQYGIGRTGLPAKSTIRRWARAALKGMRRKHAALGVRIVGSVESEIHNTQFRHQQSPTNVLAFPFDAPPGVRSEILGDLIICAPVVKREARAQQKSFKAHWAHIVVHGILHLRGYDHQNRQDARAMEQMEIRILKQLGYANPYHS